MSDTNLSAPPPVPPPAPPSPAGDPWHKGIDAEIIGHWSNKGLDYTDPAKIAVEMTKQHRAAERHFGVPADQLLKMPKADAKPEDIKAFWAKLGAGEAKDYDLSTVKLNGEPLDDALATTMRDALASAFVPKDKAVTIAAAVAKHIEEGDRAKTTIEKLAIDSAKDDLKKSWGKNVEYNFLVAERAVSTVAKAAGISEQQASSALQALKDAGIGRAEIMKMFYAVGSKMAEDTFVERGADGSPAQGIGVTTREGAVSRLADLQKDLAWGKRFTSGDQQANQEFQLLTTMIAGAT